MLTIVIPAAGEGQRFKDAGYTVPKPLIPVLGIPMIERVLQNVTPRNQPSARVVISSADIPRFQLGPPPDGLVSFRIPPTRGALQTILAVEDMIDHHDGLLIANCDQLVDFDVDHMVEIASDRDGAVICFPSTNSHHSYVDTDDQGIITLIMEKEVLPSHYAVAGIYYFRHAKTFLYSAERIVAGGVTTKGEFYVSLAIMHMIQQGRKLIAYHADTAILGTPDELQLFEMAARVAKTL